MRFKPIFRDIIITFIACFFLDVILMKIYTPYSNWGSFDFLIHRPFWSGTFVLFLLFNVFFFFKKSWNILLLSFLFILLTGFGFANSIKIEKRSDPIVPSDIYLLKESWTMAKQYVSTQQFLLFGIGLVIFLIIPIFILRKKWKPSAPLFSRIIVSIVCAVSLLSIATIKSNTMWNKFGVSNKITMPIQNLSDNGFVMGNLLELTMMYQQKPNGYSKDATEKYIQKLNKTSVSNSETETSNKDQKANVIVILLEAFFDPTILPNVTFSQDPIPFFHSLQQKFTNGKMLVNVFGAGTANTEFEVLTSMSMQLFPYKTHPYTSHVIQPVDSVAYRIKAYGYNTSGMHNNVGWFYNRQTALSYLGIDYMQFSDQMFKEDKNIQTVYDVPAVPKDIELFKRIYQRTSATKGRDFVQGVTMGLHGPYTLWYDHDIKVSSGKLSQKSKDILEEYAYKIHEVDKAIQELITSYQNSKEPTMIVMYGDHLPWLGDNQLVYNESGYNDSSISFENHNRMYATPYLIWDNYLNKPKSEVNLGSSFLMPYVFKELGIKGNGLHTFLQEKMKQGIYRLPPADFQKQEGWAKKDITYYRDLQYYYLNEPTATKK